MAGRRRHTSFGSPSRDSPPPLPGEGGRRKKSASTMQFQTSGDESDNSLSIPLKQFHRESTVVNIEGEEAFTRNTVSPPERLRSAEKRERRRDKMRSMDEADEENEESAIRQITEALTTSETEGNVSISKTTTALLLAEEGGEGSRNYWSSVSFVPPVHWTQEDWDRWNSLTFYASNDPVLELEEKEDIESRVPLDEGLFAGEPAQMSKGNWNRLYCRLLKQNARYWFEIDGKLLCQIDPYRKVPVQLFKEDVARFMGQEQTAENKEVFRFIPAKLDPFKTVGFNLFGHLYELEVDLGYVYFHHHPLFSKEHVVASLLQTAYDSYSNLLQKRSTERPANRLKALREAVAHTKSSIVNIYKQIEEESNPNTQKKLQEMLKQQKERLMSYRKDMEKASLARDQGFWDDKASIAAVLEAWRDLKGVREEQGYVNTPLKLNIMEVPSDPKEDLENWNHDIEQDLQDIMEQSEEIFELQMAKYNGKMKRWNARKSQNKGRERGDSNNAGSDYESDVSLSKRPKAPQKPSFNECKRAIEKRYKEIRRRPGEPHIMLELNNNASVTQTNQLPEQTNSEKQRRRALNKCKVELILWLNGNEIFRSKPRDISPDFVVFLGFKVPISVTEKPDLLEFEIVDVDTQIRTLKIPIDVPNSQISIERSTMKRVMFFADDAIRVSHAGVGSGINLEINGKEYEGIHSKGEITIRCGWAIDTEGNLVHPDTQKYMPDDQEDDEKQFVGRKMSSASVTDPNDPRNAYRLHGRFETSELPVILQEEQESLKHEQIEAETDQENEFIIDKLMQDFNFCDDSVIEKSNRYKVLQLRDEGVPEFKNLKMVPSNEKEISSDIFLAYERRSKEDQRKTEDDTGKALLTQFGRKKKVEDEFVYESNRLEKIKEIRLAVLQLFEKTLKQITFEDMVVEEQIPDIGTLGLNLMSFFQPRRPLRPIRKERKRVQASNLVDTKIDLVFNIVRAFNLPLRKDTDVGLISTETITGVQLQKKRAERGHSSVRPFVEVWFQRKKVRTTTALGSNPTWNQELLINLSVPNDDYSQTSLSKMDDQIFLLLYDEVPIDLLEDDRRRETDIHQRIEKRWLGSITIPFSTLYNNGRIEGTFKLNMPAVLLGYESQGMSSHFGGIKVSSKGLLITEPSAATSGATKTQTPQHANITSELNAFLTIFITLQPAVQPIISIKEDSGTGESSEMMAFVKNWKNLFERKFKDRSVRPFVMTAEGDTILCTRYLTPMEPPHLFLDEDGDILHTMEMLAHYVSLFPYIRDITLGITHYSLWITSDVFLGTPGGGTDDHAVLLACYFHYLNIPCWIVQGNAIPDGPTTFVVSSFKGMGEEKDVPKGFKNAVLVWNPCTGEYHNANDNFCPLQKVWSAIGKQNIWANVSEFERPYQLDWNVGKSNGWLPLFSKAMPEEKIPCVQPEIKRFKTADQNQANSLAQRVERNLKEAFMKWRSNSRTNWNRHCSAILRRLLPKLENNKIGRYNGHGHHTAQTTGTGSVGSAINIHSVSGSAGSVASLNEEHLVELREIMTSYEMSGFPLQQPYVNMHSIMEAVFATGLHTIDTPDVEFALAAYSVAYPASVYSLWVYVAALHRRK